MIYLWSVHLNGVRQTFWGQEHFQANITIITYFKKNLNNVRKRICFSGFKYYHNPKHSGPHTAGRQEGGGGGGGGELPPWENYIYDFLECH
jgi:hypothetical protein